jgi:hypothetical protein
MTQVVALTCQQCGVDFPAMGGGVCTSCKRTLCASHYGRPSSDEDALADTGLLTCDDCRAKPAARR